MSKKLRHSLSTINTKFNQRVCLHTANLDWQSSPVLGVDRRMLDRVGKEVARATSIVRYAPGSKFSAHTHTGGEEFIVLEGTFQDEHRDYPAGSYVRNPPTSSHIPRSDKGCMIFVKLWQFEPDDRQYVNSQIPTEGERLLFKDAVETVCQKHIKPYEHINLSHSGGIEILVLSGELIESFKDNKINILNQHTWLRIPCSDGFHAKAGAQGANLWIKTGHLSRVDEQIKRVMDYIK